MEMHGDSPEVHRLPPPDQLPCDEYGNPISVRIPPPLPKDNEPFCINYVSFVTEYIVNEGVYRYMPKLRLRKKFIIRMTTLLHHQQCYFKIIWIVGI